mgnify:CR=1 FL=1
MKLTISQLKQIINEELSLIDEELTDDEKGKLQIASSIIQVYVAGETAIGENSTVGDLLVQIGKDLTETV